MYFKKPVTVMLGQDFYFFSKTSQEGQCQAVMDLDKAKAFIRFFKRVCKGYAYATWLEDTKREFPCLLCGEDDPNALLYHHLGQQYTRMSKTDRIANMVANQLPLYVIVHE